MKDLKVFILIPVFNEEERILGLIEKILSMSKDRIVIINDGSTDDTLLILRKRSKKNKQIKIISYLQNEGKGFAMRRGCEFAWKKGADAVIFMDGDGQHSYKYLSRFKYALKNHKLVFGYRKLGKDAPAIRKWGNWIAKKLIKFLFKIDRKDLLCGFFAFRREVYNKIKWESEGYGVETEIATKTAKQKLDFKEIKINTTYIDKYKGVTIYDAFKILLRIPGWYIREMEAN